jgi:PAS domain S-box-containing protein
MGSPRPASAEVAQARGRRRHRLALILGRLPRAFGAVALAIGALVLAGWTFGFDRLTTIVWGWPPMAPNSAAMSLLGGLALLLLAPVAPSRAARIVGRTAAALVILLAILTLVEYATGRELGMERLFPHAGSPGGPVPARSAPHSAVGFLFTGAALLSLKGESTNRVKLAEVLALAGSAVPVIGLLGYVFSVPELYVVPSLLPHAGMAVHTASVVLMLTMGILASRPASGIMAVVASAQAGGTMARRLILSLAALVPAGFLLGYGQRQGWYDAPVTAALFVTLALVEGLAIILLTANRLNRDDDAREAAEGELRRSEERFRDLFEQASDGVFISDLAGRYTAVNEFGARLIGYAPEELVGMFIKDIIPPEDADRLDQQQARLLGGGSDVSEWSLRHRDGHYIPVEVSAKILPDGRWQGVVRDITVRKWLEEQTRREQAERVRNLEEQSFLARVGEVLASSLSYRDTLENAAELAVGFLGDTCTVDVVEDDGTLHRLKIASAGRADGALVEALQRGVPGHAHPHWTALEDRRAQIAPEVPADLRRHGMKSMMVVPLIARGRPIGVLTVGCCGLQRAGGAPTERDVRMADELGRRVALALDNAHLYEIANEAIEARDQMLGIVAHDLRSPLGVILLHAERSGPPKGQIERRSTKHVDSIRKAATRMDRLIQNLLDVKRVEAGHLEVERRLLGPGELVAEAMEASRSAAGEAGIDLDLEIAGGLPDLLGDRDRLLQVLDNLIGNALKFTDPGGRILVSVSATDHEVMFQVADTGHGIAPDDIPRLFEPFWQAHKTDRRGAGLGLPIVKGIVEAHGGRVSVESRLGAGTTFTFTIPTALSVETRPSGGPGS